MDKEKYTPLQARLMTEYFELHERRIKLGDVINRLEDPEGIDKDELKLMREQYRAMDSYEYALERRMTQHHGICLDRNPV